MSVSKIYEFSVSAKLRNAPPEVRNSPIVGWLPVEVGGRITKPPISFETGFKCDITNLKNTVSWEVATRHLECSEGDCPGIGFVLTRRSQLAVIDLDKVAENPEAAKRIQELVPSYCERSPSQDGLHILVNLEGDKPEKKIQKWKLGGMNVEIFYHSQFITFTGDVVNKLPVRPHDLAELKDWLKSQVSNEGAADASSEDLGLCNTLAAEFKGDAKLIDHAFRRSERMRDKWDEPGHTADGLTYGQMTVAKAVEGWQANQAVKPTKQKGRGIVISAKEIKAVEPKWLIPDYIPGDTITIFAGDGGEGKGTTALGIAADLSMGRPCLGLSYAASPPCDSLIIGSSEDSLNTIQARLIGAKADLGRVHIFKGIPLEEDGEAFRPWTVNDVGYLRQELVANQNVKLIIIDPVSDFLGGRKDNQEAEVRAWLSPLARLAQEFGVAVICVKHYTKNDETDRKHRIQGSSAYRDAARMNYGFETNKDASDSSHKLMLYLKGNEKEPVGLKFHIECLADEDAEIELGKAEVALDLVGEARQKFKERLVRSVFDGTTEVKAVALKKLTKVDLAKRWLLEFLGIFSFPREEVDAARVKAGFTADNIKDASEELVRSKQLFKVKDTVKDGRWIWGLGEPSQWVRRPQVEQGELMEEGFAV